MEPPVSAPVRARAPAPVAPLPAPAIAPQEGGAGLELWRWEPGKRTRVSGEFQADWLVVGDKPEEGADFQGEPLAVQVGRLLDNMLLAVGLARGDSVCIANLRTDTSEAALRHEVAQLRPRIILSLGALAVKALLQTTDPIGRLRGRVHRFADVPLVVTYHPAYLLRNQPDKARAWADLVLARSVLG
jgi:DNA polymerase